MGGGESNYDVIVIKFSELDAWLKSQPENTPETAYKLNITELTVDDVRKPSDSGTLGDILKKNEYKYTDLSFTILPEGVESLQTAFAYCRYLVKSPTIPEGVWSLYEAYEECSALVETPIIPSSVTHVGGAFRNCKSLVNAPTIPDGVSSLENTFSGCTSLVKAPAIPDRVNGMTATFCGCSSLVTIPNVPVTVTSMTGAFQGCASLQSIQDFRVKPGIYSMYGVTIFKDNPSTLKIYVPEENLAAWKAIDPSELGLASTDVFVKI